MTTTDDDFSLVDNEISSTTQKKKRRQVFAIKVPGWGGYHRTRRNVFMTVLISTDERERRGACSNVCNQQSIA